MVSILLSKCQHYQSKINQVFFIACFPSSRLGFFNITLNVSTSILKTFIALELVKIYFLIYEEFLEKTSKTLHFNLFKFTTNIRCLSKTISHLFHFNMQKRKFKNFNLSIPSPTKFFIFFI